jgi:hypothetical protein
MSKAAPAVDRQFRPLIDALDCGYRHDQAEMFRWMLHRAFELMGIHSSDIIPDDAKSMVENSLAIYQETVFDSTPFTDVLGPVYMGLASRWGGMTLPSSSLSCFSAPRKAVKPSPTLVLPRTKRRLDVHPSLCLDSFRRGFFLSYTYQIVNHEARLITPW